jgi:hypothetical protein
MMGIATRTDWTAVVNFDNYGSFWGYETVEQAEAGIAEERANSAAIDEWNVTDPAGLPIRIVRIADPEFLDTIHVFPAECDHCGDPLTKLAWTPEEHKATCPLRDPHF